MKRLTMLCMAVCLFGSMATAYAESPKREFRATWLAAVGVDWPDNKVSNGTTTEINKQKAELSGYLDVLVGANMNAICYHVRPMADAFYKSTIDLVPWSHYLTGWNGRGKDPKYDPLAYAVQEAHARGLELHAWVNPFRYEAAGLSHGANDPIRKKHPDWILTYTKTTTNADGTTTTKTSTILDPANPDVRAHIVAVVQDIIEHYDVDGIIFDDYFYPYGGTTTEDAASQKKWNTTGMNVHDWRRENVDKTVKAVYDMIAASSKPWVRFGISPFGIWTTEKAAADKYNVTLPTGISGSNTYKDLGCNTLSWMQGGYVDYVSPQLYWPTTQTAQSYTKLSQWWSSIAKTMSDRLSGNKKVHFFSSQDVSTTRKNTPAEIGKQVDYNRQYDKLSAPGSIFFSYKDFVGREMDSYLVTNKFTQRSLPPAMDWKSTTTLTAPTNLKLSGSKLSWTHTKAERFTVYAYTKGSDKTAALASSSNLVGVVYGKSIDLSKVSGYSSKTLAVCAYDRYGNEYEAGLYNAATSGQENPNPSTGDFTFGSLKFHLQGGSLHVPVDNEALWNAMWKEFKTAYSMINYTVSGFVTPDFTYTGSGYKGDGNHDESSIARFLQNCFYTESNTKYTAIKNAAAGRPWDTDGIWEWLGDYFYAISSTYPGGILNFCYDTQCFLQTQAAGSLNYNKIDWTDNGQPSAWKPAYIFGHKPTKSGDTFLGWYDNAAGNGSPITKLPTAGDVYACWKSGISTDVDDIETISAIAFRPTYDGVEIFFTGTQPVQIYHVNGMLLQSAVATDSYACTLLKGMYIIRVGNEVRKYIQ